MITGEARRHRDCARGRQQRCLQMEAVAYFSLLLVQEPPQISPHAAETIAGEDTHIAALFFFFFMKQTACLQDRCRQYTGHIEARAEDIAVTPTARTVLPTTARRHHVRLPPTPNRRSRLSGSRFIGSHQQPGCATLFLPHQALQQVVAQTREGKES